VTSPLLKGNVRFARAVLGGVIAGLLLLLNPSSLLIVLPWIAFLLWRAKTPSASTFKPCALVLIVLATFAVAWCGRNYYQLGAFALRTNLGMTLFASNNDCAKSSLIREELNGCYQQSHPNVSLQEATLLHRLGEAQYDRIRIAASWQWVRANPEKFWWLTMARVWQFWFPATEELPAALGHGDQAVVTPDWMRAWATHQNHVAYGVWLITALSIPGLVLVSRRREPVAAFVVIALVTYPAMYYIVVSDIRYRYPVLWISLLLAGYFLSDVAEVWSRNRSHDATTIRNADA